MDHSREKLFDFASLCLWLIASAAMAGYVFLEYGQDFRGYYAAARVLLEGGNPYDYTRVAAVLMEVTGRAGNNPFYYPLWFGWSIAPLSLLPFQTARAIWMLFNLALWIYGLLRLQQFLGFPPKGWRGWLLDLLATFLFAWTTWKFEQAGIILFVITVEILLAYKNQRWNRMGIFMALALIKPNIMLLPMLVLALWLVRNKFLRPVITALVTLFALVLVTTLLTPGWYQPFLQPHFSQGITQVLDGPNQVTGARLNTTLLDWLKWYSVPVPARYGIYIVVVLACLWLLGRTVWKSDSILEVLVVSLLVVFVSTPYALQYDFPPLVIVLFWALASSAHASEKTIPILIVLFLASIIIWERPISDGYWMVIGLVVLAIWVSRTMNRDTRPPQLLSHSQ
ncbi:MAG: glycosyltransferase family 87 protein [Bacteroidota bacterium]